MKEFYESNKKALITSLIIILITIIIIIITNIIDKTSKVNKPDDILKKMGIDYYESYLHPTVKSDVETSYVIFENYSINGIKLTLRDIVSMYKTVDAEMFYRKGMYCDFINTYVIIYPKSPYGVKDYTIKTNIVCSKKPNQNNDIKYKPDISDGTMPGKDKG